MKTAITELFGVRYPILLAGMGRVALPHMVAAVSNAGGLGVLGAGSSAPELTREYIREIRSLTDKPFGVNTPLMIPNGRENAEIALQEKAPIINYSMGKGDWIAQRAHAYGGKAIASVTNIRLATSAQKHGADAVIATGVEAAGHAGDVTTFVLIPRLVEILKIPVIAAGGVANGAGLMGALALGAAGVSMGTRFLLTKESPLHQNFKDAALDLDVTDTIFSDRFDGVYNRVMATPAAARAERTWMNPFQVFLDSFGIARELRTPYLKLLLQVVSAGPSKTLELMRMSQMLKMHTITLTSGDVQTGMTASGMSVGLVHDVPTIAELMERMVAEARSVHSRINTQMAEDARAPTLTPA